MIQDIYPYQLNNHYDPEASADPESFVVSFKEKKLLLKLNSEDHSLIYPKLKELTNVTVNDLVYLFNIGSEEFFLLQDHDGDCKTKSDDFDYYSIRDIRDDYYEPRRYVFAAYTSYQLSEWYEVTKFCGRCGNPNENDVTERARKCPKCGNIIYPRINPAVIIGVTDKNTNKIILTKYRTGFAHNALVAGFTEIGETLEETVAREVMEEVGLRVENIRYYKSQPWGIASDILAGFFCDVKGDPTIKMDKSELKYAEWVAPPDIILQPMDYSLTNEMMKLFKDKGYEGSI